MKSFFTKLFGFRRPENGQKFSEPQIPSPLQLDNLKEFQKRAFVGFVARKLAKQMSQDHPDLWKIIYWPFAKETFEEDREEETFYLLYLAELMVDSIANRGDIYYLVRENQLPEKYRECFLRVYEEVKEQISTAFKTSREQEEDDEYREGSRIWRVYRDVLFAVTQRKFLLIENKDIPLYKEGQLLCEVPIQERQDIPKARDIAKQSLLNAGLGTTKVMSMLLAISEGITNVLKHAKRGTMYLVKTNASIHVLIDDEGPGIDLKLLPYAALLAGYSTKKSLGQGFTLMMKMADQLLLSTDSDGSCIILVFGSAGEVRPE